MALYVPNVNPAVTAQDSANNNTPDDVIGNKTDTVAGTSLVSIELQQQAMFNVPLADAAAHADIADIVGNKADTIAGDSLMALTRRLNDGPGRIYSLPLGAAGVTLTGGAGAWANPANWTQIVATSPAVATRIVGLAFDTPSGAMLAEIDLGLGAGDPAAAIVTYSFRVATDASFYLPSFITKGSGRVAANTRVAGRVRTAAGGAQTINVKVLFQAIGS